MCTLLSVIRKIIRHRCNATARDEDNERNSLLNMPSMEPAGLRNAMRLHELYKIPGANPSDIRRGWTTLRPFADG